MTILVDKIVLISYTPAQMIKSKNTPATASNLRHFRYFRRSARPRMSAQTRTVPGALALAAPAGQLALVRYPRPALVGREKGPHYFPIILFDTTQHPVHAVSPLAAIDPASSGSRRDPPLFFRYFNGHLW